MKMNSFNDYLISFGAPYADATASKGADVQPYKYNGKELDLMHVLTHTTMVLVSMTLFSRDGIGLIHCARSTIAQVRMRIVRITL